MSHLTNACLCPSLWIRLSWLERKFVILSLVCKSSSLRSDNGRWEEGTKFFVDGEDLGHRLGNGHSLLLVMVLQKRPNLQDAGLWQTGYALSVILLHGILLLHLQCVTNIQRGRQILRKRIRALRYLVVGECNLFASWDRRSNSYFLCCTFVSYLRRLKVISCVRINWIEFECGQSLERFSLAFIPLL